LQSQRSDFAYQVRNSGHLPATQFIELYPGHAAAKHGIQQRVMTMAYQVDMCSHAIAPTRHRR